jgi:hypothetical protein
MTAKRGDTVWVLVPRDRTDPADVRGVWPTDDAAKAAIRTGGEMWTWMPTFDAWETSKLWLLKETVK